MEKIIKKYFKRTYKVKNVNKLKEIVQEYINEFKLYGAAFLFRNSPWKSEFNSNIEYCEKELYNNIFVNYGLSGSIAAWHLDEYQKPL